MDETAAMMDPLGYFRNGAEAERIGGTMAGIFTLPIAVNRGGEAISSIGCDSKVLRGCNYPCSGSQARCTQDGIHLAPRDDITDTDNNSASQEERIAKLEAELAALNKGESLEADNEAIWVAGNDYQCGLEPQETWERHDVAAWLGEQFKNISAGTGETTTRAKTTYCQQLLNS